MKFKDGDRVYITEKTKFGARMMGSVTSEPAIFGLSTDYPKGVNVVLVDPFKRGTAVFRVHADHCIKLPPVGAWIRYYNKNTPQNVAEGEVISNTETLTVRLSSGRKDYLIAPPDYRWMILPDSEKNVVATVSAMANWIVFEGNTTTAYYKDNKGNMRMVQAKCSPTDSYDREKGKEIAVLRMLQACCEAQIAEIVQEGR